MSYRLDPRKIKDLRSKPRIYIAGPINSSGTPSKNVVAAFHAGNVLRSAGMVPYLPHLNTFWGVQHPCSAEEWLSHDRVWLELCDAVLRLPGHSLGADIEVAWAKASCVVVFDDIPALLLWASTWTEDRPPPAKETA